VAFLSPLFLLGAAAIAIPVAIHLFFRRTDPVIPFAAMRFLRRAPVEQASRRRLRELLLLALRAAALLLLAFAFARPYLAQSASAVSAPATVVMVDTSASVSTPAQFERVRTRALDVIRSAAPNHEVGVVTFAHGANVLAPLSADRAGAVAAVSRLKPGAGATRYRAALHRAAEEFGDRAGRIVVITDLQQSGWDADEGGVPERIAVEVEDVGGASSNVAVLSLRVEGNEAVATVRSFAQSTTIDQVVFALGDRRIGAVAVTLHAGGTAEARMVLPEQAAGALAASITDRDGYAADNIRYAVVNAADVPSILAVTPTGHPSESLYLERALLIAEGSGGFRFRAISGRDFSDRDAGASSPATGDDVIVVLGTRGLEQRGRERLAAFVGEGGGLLVAAGPDVDPAVIREALGGVIKTSWRARASTELRASDAAALSFAPDDSRHPIFRLFGGVGTLGNVTFARAALVEPADSDEVLARYSDGTPAVVEERTSGGRIILFASDLNNRGNDFPLQPAFVPFVHETVRYLAAARASRSAYLVGELAGPQGSAPGVVTLGGGRTVAVNVDTRESDPARMTVDEFQAGVARLNATAARQAGAQARSDEDRQRLWQYALLLMVVSLAAEGIVGRRLG
jgi:hypothetical protein